jgi:3-phenylpropionate/trans-cinnamate dioxygenase ferredoxin reductase subunit
VAETDVLLIGGGVASVRCARTLRRDGFEGSILIVGAESHDPYNRPPLSKELLRDDLPDGLVLAEPSSWYERRRIDLATGARVERLDPDAGVAELDDGSTVRFDRCLVATGAAPVALPVPGAEHALLLRTLDDARELRRRAIAAASGSRATVVGGGLIGIEVASGMAALGLRPIILEREPALWAGALGSALDAWAREALEAVGVEVRLGATVTRLEPDAVHLGGERIESRLALAGIGVRPRVELGIAAGLAEDDGLVTDAGHRTSHPAVWAAGDVARAGGLRFEHWHAAREGGERAAQSMLGREIGAPRAPWLFTEVAGTTIDVIGHADGWDEERWIRPGAVLAHLVAGRVVRLAAIGSALDPEVARGLVEASSPIGDIEAVLRDA